MTGDRRRLERILAQVAAHMAKNATLLYKDGESRVIPPGAAISTVLLRDAALIDHVECGPGCGELERLINGLLDE